MRIRDAAADDAGSIAEIYNDAVANSTAIWNDATVSAADRRAWIEARQAQGCPVLVAVGDAGDVIGYASFGDWRAFDGYRGTAEHSVYVRSGRRGGGIGEALLAAIVERARSAGKHVLVAGIEAGNEASIRLHEKLGFEHAGTLAQVGQKFGTWLDLAFMQLRLDDRPAP